MVSIRASNPDEVDVTVAVYIGRDKVPSVITQGSKAEFLAWPTAELDAYRLVEAIRLKGYEVRFVVGVGSKRDGRDHRRMRFVSVMSLRVRARNARKHKQRNQQPGGRLRQIISFVHGERILT